MRRLVSLLALLVLGALAGSPSAIAADCTGGDVRPAADNIPQIAATTLCLINEERRTAGLGALSEQAQLTKASADFSALMVAEHFFAHVSPDGGELTDRLATAGYLGNAGSWVVGENIAWGESYLATPDNIVKAWMNSAPHKANILKGDYDEIGLGIVLGTPTTPHPGATYTTDFGRRSVEGAPAPETASDVTVGDAAPAPAQARNGTRGASTRSPGAASRKAEAARRTLRRSRAACRRSHRRAGMSRRSTGRVRCVGVWRAVQSHL